VIAAIAAAAGLTALLLTRKSRHGATEAALPSQVAIEREPRVRSDKIS
jgi:hypothetical protein